MSMTLNRSAFEKLIRENIEWLEQQPRALERDHIIAICRHAPDMYYGRRDAEGRIVDVWDPHQHRFPSDPPAAHP